MKRNGSSYAFYRSNAAGYSWIQSRERCTKAGCDLVSIETYDEWEFLKNATADKKWQTGEYFIGLRKDRSSRKWRWVSDNSTVNASRGTWPWAKQQPSNDSEPENCVQMYKDYRKDYGLYNDISCTKEMKITGYICEGTNGCYVNRPNRKRTVTSTITSARGSTTGSQVLETSGIKEMPKTTLITHTFPYSKETSPTAQNRSTFYVSTKGVTSSWITSWNTNNESPLGKDVDVTKPNVVVIVIVLLAIFILGLIAVFGLLFFRRHRKQDIKYKDRVTCSKEMPSTSERQSIDDPVLVHQTQSSAELTVHLTLSRTESELATYETASDCQKECQVDNIDKAKSMSVGGGHSDFQEQARDNTALVSGERGIKQPPILCSEKEESKDHVYAVVHKDRKGTASLGERDTATESETLQTGGNTEYLYTAVDKTVKKKKPPQMPPPYRGLVYADLVLSRENSAKFVKEQTQTVYAQIDHVKTANVKILEQNLEETKEGEHW
ncbi:uncharacterized protein LOC111319250 [Stylophora pistillata]|uniref:uncharacterized protein LOC111319250 n=1 Tax=Stylophora pistillata TaxID=50429 RepID=UPI000C04BC33|nr:uncharacterized protein LOC111319250 [Stylophora pistillata]